MIPVLLLALGLGGSPAAAQDESTERYCARWNDSGNLFCRYGSSEECEAAVINADATCLRSRDGSPR